MPSYPNRTPAERRAYARGYYEKNKARSHAAAKVHMDEKKAWTRKQKEVPCMDCGVQYPYYQMEYDHVRGAKLFNMGTSWRYGWDTIRAERAKCDIVCCMCHRERTHQRKVNRERRDDNSSGV